MIFRNWVLQNFPFLEDDFDALTDYELFCKMVEYMRKSLDKVKDYQNELNEFRTELDSYKNYFETLDVQEEINNKLDEMAEDGTLENIISEYIQLMTTYAYNTVDDMLDAENLVDGSFARTSGFYSYNDGGGAYYKIRNITNEDVIDNITLFALVNSETLVAELIINDEMNIKQFGAVDDNTTDNSDIFNKVATLNIKKINFYGDTFKLSETIDVLDKENIELNFNCKLHMASSNNAGTSCFRLLRCKDININGYYVYSDRDKTEEPQGTSTRVSSLGSNIDGLTIRSCKNVYIDNVYFENMYNDFVIAKYDLDSLEDYPVSENIYITNYTSLNSSQNNKIANSKNINYKNVNLKPAIDMGSGDHGWYFTENVDTVNIENLYYETQDDNFCIIFQCNTSGTASKNIKVVNSYIKSSSLLYVNKDSDIYFDNLTFYDNETGNNKTYIISTMSNAFTRFHNCRFENLNTSFFASGEQILTEIDNCYFKQRDKTINIFSLSGATNSNVKITNTYIANSRGLVVYTGGVATGSVDISNCYIEKVSGYCYERRNTGMKLFLNNTRVINDGETINHFNYNGSGVDSTNVIYLNLYIKGFTNAVYDSTNLVCLNSYLNNTLIVIS